MKVYLDNQIWNYIDGNDNIKIFSYCKKKRKGGDILLASLIWKKFTRHENMREPLMPGKLIHLKRQLNLWLKMVSLSQRSRA